MKTFFDYSLKSYNTFGIDSIAKTFVELESISDIKAAIDLFGIPNHILGWWSNVILPTLVEWVIWHSQFIYKNHLLQDSSIILTIGAWENRHSTVLYTIDNGWWWIENLIAIPWNIGASPVQNIGAYWVELQDVFVQCTVYNFDTQSVEILDKQQCHFGYRHSIFKEYPNRYMVIDITLELSTKKKPVMSYKPIIEYFTKIWLIDPTQKQIAMAIEEIRWSKLPKPEVLGNCWSFFQNPIISWKKLSELIVLYPDIPHYPNKDWKYKLSAAWLIEKAWLKWYIQWNVWTYEHQPLVIVQYWNATNKDVVWFSWYIIDQVASIFWVILQREVNIW